MYTRPACYGTMLQECMRFKFPSTAPPVESEQAACGGVVKRARKLRGAAGGGGRELRKHLVNDRGTDYENLEGCCWWRAGGAGGRGGGGVCTGEWQAAGPPTDSSPIGFGSHLGAVRPILACIERARVSVQDSSSLPPPPPPPVSQGKAGKGGQGGGSTMQVRSSGPVRKDPAVKNVSCHRRHLHSFHTGLR